MRPNSSLLATLCAVSIIVTTVSGNASPDGSAAPSHVTGQSHQENANLRLAISEQFFRSCVQRPVDRTGPVQDVILGTRISGTSHTVGSVDLELVPNNSRAELRVVFRGLATARTLGRTGRVQTDSISKTSIDCGSVLYLDHRGLRAMPAHAHGSTELQVTRVHITSPSRLMGRMVPERLIRRGAWKSINRTRRQREQIIANRASQKSQRRMDLQLHQTTLAANSQLQSWLLDPLRRELPSISSVRFHTTADAVCLSARLPDQEHHGAPLPAPKFHNSDVAIWVHQSALRELARQKLAGRTFSHSLPSGLSYAGVFLTSSHESRTSACRFTLGQENPVSIRIDDDRVSASVRGESLVLLERDMGKFQLDLCFRIEPKRHGACLQLLGAPKLTIAKSTGFSPWKAIQQQAINVGLYSACSRGIFLDGIALPEALSGPRGVRVNGLSTSNGWLHVTLQRYDLRDSSSELAVTGPDIRVAHSK